MLQHRTVCAYTAVFEPDPIDGGYVVTVPALPGCVTEADTLDEARAMAADAMQGYLETLLAEGEPLPENVAAPQQAQSALIEIEIPTG